MYQICVSGASRGESVEEGSHLAREAGKVIAKEGHSLLTGATIGLPNIAAEAYKKAGGKMSVGISPASSKIEHVLKYRLPTEHYDTILFTGLHYVGRDSLLINSSDAVISIGGRMGTLHEFTIAIETDTPIGFIMGAGGISNEITDILDLLTAADRIPEKQVFFADDAQSVMAKLTKELNKQNRPYRRIYA
ncbi:hypothetical protein KC946_00025 [Candidatus Saccharibacteria bacterium]|nr:hypothetical protein [Candidatus Saccharibacteria bacterium]